MDRGHIWRRTPADANRREPDSGHGVCIRLMPELRLLPRSTESHVLASPKTPPDRPPLEKSEGRAATVEEARLRQQAIGYKLRQMFDDVVSEPVPDEFLDILKQADSASRNGR